MSIWPKSLVLLFAALVSLTVHAAPLTEVLPANNSAPLSVLSTAPTDAFIPQSGDFADRYIVSFNGTQITLVDLVSWDEALTQPDAFTNTLVGIGILGNGTSLIGALSNGNLVRIELDDESTFADTDPDVESEDEDTTTDTTTTGTTTTNPDPQPTDSREINSREVLANNSFSALATDPAAPNSQVVYLISENAQAYYEYNLASDQLVQINLGTTTTGTETTPPTTTYTPKKIVIAHSTSATRAVVMTTTNVLLVVTPGSGSYTAVTLPLASGQTTTPTFGTMAVSSSGRYVFVTETTENEVWVLDTTTNSFVDQTASGTTLDPFNLGDIGTITGLDVYADDSGDVLYVSSSAGITIVDASAPGTKADDKTISTLALNSGTPSFIKSTSADSGYVMAFKSDGAISVLTDNPWITAASTSVTTLTESAPDFTLTFQSDTAGDYKIKIGADITGSTGTTLIDSTAFTDVNTDIVSASISMNSFDREVFEEGENLISVFVTDADGNVGRDAITLNVDRPPGNVTTTGAQFGNRRAYITFTPVEDEDIDFYTARLVPSESQARPSCPGTLTFSEASVVSLTVDGATCTSTSGSCEAQFSNLTNDTTYCVALQATDLSAQTGPITPFTGSVRPEATVGPAAFLGESGCSLNPDKSVLNFSNTWGSSAIAILTFATWILRRLKIISRRLQKFFWIGLGFLIATFFFGTAKAQEIPNFSYPPPGVAVATPPAQETAIQTEISNSQNPPKSVFGKAEQKDFFTFEARASFWIPTNSGVQTFFSACCNPVGEVEFGYVFRKRYHVTVAAGGSYFTGNAIGINSGAASGDRFSMFTIPVRLDFAYRFDFVNEQIIVPFLRAGFDSVYFHETSDASSINGNKFGFHAAAGLSILLDNIDKSGMLGQGSNGIDNVYLSLEGRYAMINNFGSGGLDFSGFYPYIGVLFQF